MGGAAKADSKYLSGRILVKLRSDSQAKIRSKKGTRDFLNRAEAIHHLKLVGSWPGINLHHLQIDPSSGKSVEDAIADLVADPDVVFAEPNYFIHHFQEGWNNQRSAAYSLNQVLGAMSNYQMQSVMTNAAIQYQTTWPTLTPGNTKAVVAVIDTGLDLTHPSFANAIWTNPNEIPSNGIDDDKNGYIDDVHGWNFAYGTNSPQDDEGHGTHVSGTVLGVGQNIFSNPAPAASATNVNIMPLKFLDSSGSGSTSNAISAIYYAVNNGAKVMNNSWGGGAYSQALAEAITFAYDDDVMFVAAAGNSSVNNDTSPSYPASYDMPCVIAVAATDDTDVLASFSNYGTASVSLSAPGVGELSTYPGGNFAYMSGTSMASPFVAGTAALMKYMSPTMNCYQIKSLILASVDKIPGLAPYVTTSGRIDVLKAVQAAMNSAPPNPYKPNYLLEVNPNDRGLASSVADRGGGCGLVSLVGNDYGDGSGKPKNPLRQTLIALCLLLLPIVLIVALRTPRSQAARRKYQRYALNSSVVFKIGDKELVGAVKTISLGGSDLNTEELLEKGSIVTMSIASPDGTSKIEVQGHIVWSEQQKRYGVAFDVVAEPIRAQISQWSKALTKV